MPRAELGRVIRRVIAVVTIVVLVDVGLAGVALFANAKSDPLQRADAIIVLAGEHDGREQYALNLARQGWARTVVLSDPYVPGDPQMKSAILNLRNNPEVSATMAANFASDNQASLESSLGRGATGTVTTCSRNIRG